MQDGTGQPSAGEVPLLPRNVVVVEEQSTNRILYAKVAESLGRQVRVHSFKKPTQALLWLKANRAALIICNLWMAELDAFELLTFLKGQPQHSATAVLVITVDATDGLGSRVLDAGASDFLTVPVALHELRSKLQRLLMLDC